MGDATAAGVEALRAVAPKSVERNIVRNYHEKPMVIHHVCLSPRLMCVSTEPKNHFPKLFVYYDAF